MQILGKFCSGKLPRHVGNRAQKIDYLPSNYRLPPHPSHFRTAEQCPYPLDIIVRKIHTVVANRNSDDDDSDEDQTAKEVNHALQMQGFNVVDRGKLRNKLVFY